MNYFRIKEVCKQRKMTGERLAEIIGISKTTISQINSGVQRPSFDTLVKISEALHVDVKDLFISTKDTFYVIHNNELYVFYSIDELKDYTNQL